MDRLLIYSDLQPTSEAAESATIPPELRAEIGKRSDAFIRMTGETFDPLLVVEFSIYAGSDTLRSVVLREPDLCGSIGENADSILRTAPDVRPDLLIRRGTL